MTIIIGTMLPTAAHAVLVRQLRECRDSEVWVLFQSDGGALGDGLAMADTIRRNKRPVIGVAEWARSAAILPFLACKSRVMMPHGELQFHEVQPRFTRTTPDELAEARRQLLDAYVSLCPRIPRSQFDRWVREERLFTATEAVRAGLADGIGT